MSLSNRLYYCCRCQTQVIICSSCDRGHRYCPGECRHLARSESVTRAGKKYQTSLPGRFKNAARQQHFRARQMQKVTHQGSPPKYLHDLLKIRLTEIKKTQKPSLPGSTCHCHYCGATCDAFLRQDFYTAGFLVHLAPTGDNMTINKETEAKILRYHFVEQWQVIFGTLPTA